MPTTCFLPYRVQFTSPTPWELGTTILDSSVVGEHSRALLQVRNHVLAFTGDVNGLFLSAFVPTQAVNSSGEAYTSRPSRVFGIPEFCQR
jgi:hypothetical protein